MTYLKRTLIRKAAQSLVKKFRTNDPIKLCKYLSIPIYYHDLGNDIMGFRTCLYGVSSIVLNSKSDAQTQRITCGHELGHDRCNHDDNTDFLKQSVLYTRVYGTEYEANCFMVELMLSTGELDESACTQEGILRSVSIPTWAADYVDWPYVKKLLVTQTGSNI